MNLLFSLTPKREMTFVYEDFTVGQALRVMEQRSFSSVPVLRRTGEYVGTLTEGDLLWGIRSGWPDFASAERAPLASLPRRSRPLRSVAASEDFAEVIAVAQTQNYVPVVDDRGMFIGIVTRRRIMKYLYEHQGEAGIDHAAITAALRK